jgi:hypothetical protein
MQAVEYRFGPGKTTSQPIEWLSDNGSCYTAANTRDFARMLGLKPIAPGGQSAKQWDGRELRQNLQRRLRTSGSPTRLSDRDEGVK